MIWPVAQDHSYRYGCVEGIHIDMNDLARRASLGRDAFCKLVRRHHADSQPFTCGISFAQRSRIGRISSLLAGGRRTVMRVTPKSRLRRKTARSSGAPPKVT